MHHIYKLHLATSFSHVKISLFKREKYTYPRYFSDNYILNVNYSFVVISGQLRALYFGDNDFETIPAEINQLKNLQVVIVLLLWYYM
jgi:Leucine-rich repeat (LRR) protein